MSDLKQALRTALVTQFRIDGSDFRDDTRLFSGGLIDSLSVMDLVALVERQIGRPVPPAAITLENFDSIERIAAFALTLTGTGEA